MTHVLTYFIIGLLIGHFIAAPIIMTVFHWRDHRPDMGYRQYIKYILSD